MSGEWKTFYSHTPKGCTHMLRQSTDEVSLAQYKSEYERMGYEVTKVKMTDLGALAKHPHVWTTKFDMKIKKQGDNMATLVRDETSRKSWVKSMLDLDDRIVSVKLTKPSSFAYVVHVDLTDGKSLEVHVDKSLAVYSGNVDAYIRSEVVLHLPPRNERILFIGGHSDGE